ncbi:MAG: hypothetical protein AAF750_15535 [Planctomycetota bacterium]
MLGRFVCCNPHEFKAITCPTCNGEAPYVHTCEDCGGSGQFFETRDCPHNLLHPEAYETVAVLRHFQNHNVLPVQGGQDDQTPLFWEALAFLHAEEAPPPEDPPEPPHAPA